MPRTLLGCCLLAASGATPGHVLVLDDFESGDSVQRWEGSLTLSPERASHGKESGKVELTAGRAEFSTTRLPRDWRGYQSLRFDVYSERHADSPLSLRIYDDNGYFDADQKISVRQGWNHVEVKLASLRAEFSGQPLSLGAIGKLWFSARRARLPWTIVVDNFRLATEEEPKETASRISPADTVTILDGRWFTLRQAARPEDVPESPAVARLRAEAERESTLLDKTIAAARLQGIETIYAERHQITAELGLRIRPLLAWFNNDDQKSRMFTYVVENCRDARRELEDVMAGTRRLPETDDTQIPEPLIRPQPPLKGRPIQDWFFRDDRGEPMMIVSMHSPSRALQRFFATPLQHIESYSVGGGSRWTIDQSPVYEAFKKYPDTHRVGWDGWCGHLVRDLDSMGGTKRENTVICLESPHTRRAVEEYIRLNTPKFHANPQLLYDIMAYELMYICYCDRSQHMFRQWLADKHGTVERANELWGTHYRNFSEVAAPPVKHSRPLPGTNRALWYDWARFNQDRFTDYLVWVRDAIRRIDPSVPLAAGGSSSMLAGRTGTTGIDEEEIINRVDDVIIHEGGGSTLGVDLQLALSENRKPLADPEMSLSSVGNLLPHFLHGKSVAQIFHWPSQPSSEFHSVNRSSLAHSPNYPLADVSELLREALDLRRLNREIAAFVDVPAQVAILYSQTSTLQLPPEMLTWRTTPYLAELEKTYEASQYLDARVTFVTERQILKGRLDRYKLLLVPAARNVPADVVERIWAYAAAGGHVVIVPESLLGDEYNHPKDYLSRLGITVRETRRPRPGEAGAMAQGYDQSFSQDVTFTSKGGATLKPVAAQGVELQTEGVRQQIQAENAATLYRYPDGSPAIVRVRIGNGVVDYAASSLETSSYARWLEAIFAEAGIRRPVRVRNVDAGGTGNIEARFAPLGERRLLYVVNHNSAPAHLRVEAPAGFFHSIEDLRARREIEGREIMLPARQTGIYELLR
ncbi:MAG: beta-galactosidase [Bryobacterales bacterium]|nr:beta-galactosidase [Bryobacterales bacterium]